MRFRAMFLKLFYLKPFQEGKRDIDGAVLSNRETAPNDPPQIPHQRQHQALCGIVMTILPVTSPFSSRLAVASTSVNGTTSMRSSISPVPLAGTAAAFRPSCPPSCRRPGGLVECYYYDLSRLKGTMSPSDTFFVDLHTSAHHVKGRNGEIVRRDPDADDGTSVAHTVGSHFLGRDRARGAYHSVHTEA